MVVNEYQEEEVRNRVVMIDGTNNLFISCFADNQLDPLGTERSQAHCPIPSPSLNFVPTRSHRPSHTSIVKTYYIPLLSPLALALAGNPHNPTSHQHKIIPHNSPNYWQCSHQDTSCYIAPHFSSLHTGAQEYVCSPAPTNVQVQEHCCVLFGFGYRTKCSFMF